MPYLWIFHSAGVRSKLSVYLSEKSARNCMNTGERRPGKKSAKNVSTKKISEILNSIIVKPRLRESRKAKSKYLKIMKTEKIFLHGAFRHVHDNSTG